MGRRNCVSSEKLPDFENLDSRTYCALAAGPEGCIHGAGSPWREDPGSPADAEHVLQAHAIPQHPLPGLTLWGACAHVLVPESSLTNALCSHQAPAPRLVLRSVCCGDLELIRLCRTTVLFQEGCDVTKKWRKSHRTTVRHRMGHQTRLWEAPVLWLQLLSCLDSSGRFGAAQWGSQFTLLHWHTHEDQTPPAQRLGGNGHSLSGPVQL